jgi:2-polyprenyl-3-methyl-5-hydroxy-6-metoxy-1,4-benzoquinol methylase
MSNSNPTCPACGHQQHQLQSAKLASPVYQCDHCGLTFCSPFPAVESNSAGQNSILTEESYTTNAIASYQQRQALFAATAQRRHEYFSQLLGRSHYRLLEVGCGIAGIADELARLGVDYSGIDLDARMVAAAQQRGCNVRTLDVFDLDMEQPFDVICFSQVLEHIKTPGPFLDRLNALLVDDGVMVCDVPNHDAFAGLPSKIKGGVNIRFGAIELPHHAIAYNRRSLQQLFAQRFQTVDVFGVTPKHKIWGQSALAGLPASGYYFLSNLLQMPSMLVAIARKS